MWKSGWRLCRVFDEYYIADKTSGACVPIMIPKQGFRVTTRWSQSNARWVVEDGIIKIGEDYG